MYTVKIKIFVEVGDSPTIRPNNLDVLLLVFVFLACIPSVVVTVVVYSSYFADQYVCVCVCATFNSWENDEIFEKMCRYDFPLSVFLLCDRLLKKQG